jgi:hypothetical protein
MRLAAGWVKALTPVTFFMQIYRLSGICDRLFHIFLKAEHLPKRFSTLFGWHLVRGMEITYRPQPSSGSQKRNFTQNQRAMIACAVTDSRKNRDGIVFSLPAFGLVSAPPGSVRAAIVNA